MRFERLDEGEGVAEIAAAGQDVRGKGGADMRMTSRVVERGPAETEVTVSSTVNISGILAQFGRGLIQDVSDEMFRRFTEAMRAALEAAGEEAGPASGASAADSADAAPLASHSAWAPGPGAEPSSAQAPAGAVASGDAAGSDALDAVSLGATVGGLALGRLVRRPGFWLAVVIVAAILWLIVD